MNAIRERIKALEAGLVLPEEQLLITQDNLKNAVREVSIYLFYLRIEMDFA